jgi:hypothetical protein
MSPRASWAWSVTPMVRVPSSSVRIHSWDLVYLQIGGKRRSWCLLVRVELLEGMACGKIPEVRRGLAITDERGSLTVRAFRRLPRMSTSTLSPGCHAKGQAGQAIDFSRRGREAAAGGFAFAAGGKNLHVRAQHALVFEHQAEQALPGALGFERGAPEEVAACRPSCRPSRQAGVRGDTVSSMSLP